MYYKNSGQCKLHKVCSISLETVCRLVSGNGLKGHNIISHVGCVLFIVLAVQNSVCIISV